MKRAFRAESSSRNRFSGVRRNYAIPRIARVANQRFQDSIQNQRSTIPARFRRGVVLLHRRWIPPHHRSISLFQTSDHQQECDLALLTVPTRSISMKLGSGGGTATLQRSKLSLKQKVRQVDPKTDNSGGGGNIGKIIHNGGGGGGDDDDDDDYFFDDGGEDGDGDHDKFFSKVLPQLYDKISITAVLSEWYRTVADMPTTLRRAIEMGLFSSAQLVRFLSMDIRPNATRAVQRSLPTYLSRGFIGRIMADPAFYHKLIIENILAIVGSLHYEMKIRGDQFKREWDLAVVNTLGVMVATTSAVWLLTPTRSFGAMSKLPWQKVTALLPNNVFDASGPLRQYTAQSRVLSVFTKSMELAFVGAVTGIGTIGVRDLVVFAHRKMDPDYKPSCQSESLSRSIVGLSLFYGLHAHTRYQLVGGIDRYFFDHSNYLWSYLTTTGLCRLVNAFIAETHRPLFAGLPTKVIERPKMVPVYRPKKQRNRSRTTSMEKDQRALVKQKVKKTKGFELSMTS
eukprot:g2385.t1